MASATLTRQFRSKRIIGVIGRRGLHQNEERVRETDGAGREGVIESTSTDDEDHTGEVKSEGKQ